MVVGAQFAVVSLAERENGEGLEGRRDCPFLRFRSTMKASVFVYFCCFILPYCQRAFEWRMASSSSSSSTSSSSSFRILLLHILLLHIHIHLLLLHFPPSNKSL
ncbi:unnamed protein product [Schistocephalus solidus]|uniref:Transmembrane protein n=1 Tax=Schistocephalus solidus TaxID=70667 RepID=A0A183TJC4_SCHSO|nr:unnamed protein product [Schistocephalus solidus]